ncbi:MAG TPA: hypothetical protein VGC87_06675, partial [Pyrinomonadaceae bacterium]
MSLIKGSQFPDQPPQNPCLQIRQSLNKALIALDPFGFSTTTEYAETPQNPCSFPEKQGISTRDEFARDCLHSHAIALSLDVWLGPSDLEEMPRYWGPIAPAATPRCDRHLRTAGEPLIPRLPQCLGHELSLRDCGR